MSTANDPLSLQGNRNEHMMQFGIVAFCLTGTVWTFQILEMLAWSGETESEKQNIAQKECFLLPQSTPVQNKSKL